MKWFYILYVIYHLRELRFKNKNSKKSLQNKMLIESKFVKLVHTLI